MEENKKSASPKKNAPAEKMAHRVYQGGHVPTCCDLPQPTLRGSIPWLWRSPSCASDFAFACTELPTIRHLDGELEIAKGRLFCNQIPHNPFITKTLIRFFTTKSFKEKTLPNHPSTPWKTTNYAIFDCKRTVPLQSRKIQDLWAWVLRCAKKSVNLWCTFG